jgi:hypothetical protein
MLEIERLETDKARRYEQLSDPNQVAGKTAGDFARLAAEQAETDRQLEALLAQWEAIESEITALESE